MGQYHFVCNIDKKEYLDPHRMGDGLKLLEFGCSASGTMLGLAILLAEQNGRGGGDLRGKHGVIGSWAGDRITLIGDYFDADDPVAGALSETPWQQDSDEGPWREISGEVREALQGDQYVAEELRPDIKAKYDALLFGQETKGQS
jgi:hypothetical protein